MDSEQLQNLLGMVKTGDVSIEEAVEKLRHLPFEDLGFARIDHHRQMRCGFPEVIYCPGKTNEQIVKIYVQLAKKGNNVLATRADEGVYEAIAKVINSPGLSYEKEARIVVLRQKDLPLSENYLAVVTAGTSDRPVAMEAKVTAETMGQQVKFICDVGVAGIHCWDTVRLWRHFKMPVS